jgi:hypothetical protein
MAKLTGLNATAVLKVLTLQPTTLLTEHVNEDKVKLTNVILVLRSRFEDERGGITKEAAYITILCAVELRKITKGPCRFSRRGTNQQLSTTLLGLNP